MSTAKHKTSPTALTPEEEAQYAIERVEIHARIAARPKSPKPTKTTGEPGRLPPLPENYLEIQAENTRRMFERWDELPPDPPGTREAILRGIDDERRRLGMRLLFEGYYSIMAALLVLDSGPLGDLATEPASRKGREARRKLMLAGAGAIVIVPEIADYEVRREILQTASTGPSFVSTN